MYLGCGEHYATIVLMEKGGSNMLQICRRIIKGEKGQSMVELALVLPMILLLLMGIVEFGRLFHTYLVITQGSREGARLAVVGESDQQIIAKIEQVTASLNVEKLSIQISPGANERIRGVSVQVSVSYELDLIVPNLFELLPDPFILTSNTFMRME